MRVSKGARWALVIVAAGALVFAAAAAARTHPKAAKSPIIIGWAHDSTGAMAPFDGPALTAAKLEVKKVNKKGVDGRKIVTPLEWYPRLKQASAAQRANFELMPMGIHWPDLDEDLGIAGMLKGRRARP